MKRAIRKFLSNKVTGMQEHLLAAKTIEVVAPTSTDRTADAKTAVKYLCKSIEGTSDPQDRKVLVMALQKAQEKAKT